MILGLAMVFISHDIQTVRYISDRIAVMNSGEVVEEGPAKELLENPQHPYANPAGRSAIAATPRSWRTRMKFRGVIPPVVAPLTTNGNWTLVTL